MPLTKSGKRILRSMMRRYGKKRGKSIFYALIALGRKGTEKWHKKRRRRKR